MPVKLFRSVVRSLLASTGRGIANLDAIPSCDRFAAALKGLGITLETVFDIGVATGTPWLYRHFKDAQFHLIEPTKESLPYMRDIAQTINAQIHEVALGSANATAPIYVREQVSDSSLFTEVGNAKINDSYEVRVQRFDELFSEFRRPALCKIDAQGSELEILRGMGDVIQQIDFVVVEVSLISTLKGSPELFDVMEFMNSKSFCLYDIVGLTRRPLDAALAQADLVFVPFDFFPRIDKRWR